MEIRRKVRIDKWLWAVRAYKSRSFSTKACNSGKVRVGGQSVKPSRLIKVGEEITFKKSRVMYTYRVLDLIEKRVSSKMADPYFEDITSKEELARGERLPSAFYAPPMERPKGAGRPTKKERREIDKTKKNTN